MCLRLRKSSRKAKWFLDLSCACLSSEDNGADYGGATVICLRANALLGIPDGASPASPHATSALDEPGDAL